MTGIRRVYLLAGGLGMPHPEITVYLATQPNYETGNGLTPGSILPPEQLLKIIR